MFFEYSSMLYTLICHSELCCSVAVDRIATVHSYKPHELLV